MNNSAWKMRAFRSKCLSPKMNDLKPEKVKKSKFCRPFLSTNLLAFLQLVLLTIRKNYLNDIKTSEIISPKNCSFFLLDRSGVVFRNIAN